MAETEKVTEYPNFQQGVMSPNSKKVFAEMRNALPVVHKQKLILDEDSFEQTFLCCLLCKERFDHNERCPRLLPCHHTYCFTCIKSFYQKEEDYRRSLAMTSSGVAFALSISCPTCKASFISTEEGLRQLVSDHRIIQLLDFVGHTDRETIVFCPNHALQPLNFFCEKCVHPICRDCTVLDHKNCSQEQLVIDLANAKEKYLPAIEEGIGKMDTEAEELIAKKNKCENALENCQKGDDTLKQSIKESFDKLRKALDEREQELLDVAGEDNPTRSKESIEEKIKKLSDKQKEIEEIKQSIKEAKASATVPDLFKVYKRLNDYKTEEGITEDEIQKSTEPSSTFNTRDERTVLSKIKNYGDIQSALKQNNGYGSSYSSSSLGSSYLSGTSRYSTYTPSYTPSRYTSNRSYKY